MGIWDPEPPLGGRLKFGSSPSATTWAGDKVRVYFFDDNNHLCFQESYSSPPPSGWGGVVDTGTIINPPDPNTGIVSPAAVNAGTGVRIFFRGQNDSLWWITSDDGTNFQGPVDIGGSTLSSDPSAASRLGSLEVFYRRRGPELLLVRRTLSGLGWSAEQPLGGQITSSPAAVSWGGIRMDVFYRGGNNDLGSRTDTGGGFRDGDDWGEQLTSAPAVASWAPGRHDVFFRGQNGHLWHKRHQEPGAGWPDADDRNLTMDAGTSPTAASTAPARLAAFFSCNSDICPLYYFERGGHPRRKRKKQPTKKA